MVLFIVILLLLLVLVTEVMQPNEVLGGEHGTSKTYQKIKGPDNPTSQILPIITKSSTEKAERTKEMVEAEDR